MVFTEHGAIQASNVLNTARAVEMGVYVVRAFVKLRELVISHAELARRLTELERRLEQGLNAHAESISALLAAIKSLMGPAQSRRRGIGFTADLDTSPK